MRSGPLIILLVSSVCSLSGGKGSSAGLDFERLPDEINAYLSTKVVSPAIKTAFDLLRQRKRWDYSFQRMDMKLVDGLEEDQIRMVNCDTCKMLVNTAISWADAGDAPELMAEKYTALCVALNIGSERVCRGSAQMRAELALWIYTQKNGTDRPLTADDFCGFNLYWECWVGGDQHEWVLDFDWLGAKPTPEEPQLPDPAAPKMKVLQLTDIHIDPNYVVGGNAACDDSNCCRWEQGEPIWPEEEAGYWGDYRKCDTPLHSFQNLLDQIASHTDVDYIIFTGDIIEHAAWATTLNSNREEIIYALSQMFEKFSVRVLPVLGNHESHPTHIFTSNKANQSLPEQLSTGWLYDLVSVLWAVWIPNARETIDRGGYYSYQVTADLKVIGLNTNFCYNFNWYLLYDSLDVSEQLMWLAGELLAAEQANQKVHILAHIPLSSDCFPGYARQYNRLIDRFENTIVAQFHGHTHQEHFNLYYDPVDPSRAINVGFVGGSGTAFGSVNPNYRVYTVDGDYPGSSFRVLDHETWAYNLTQANLAGSDVLPNWQKLYSFKEAFGLESLFPNELDALVRRMITEPDLLDLYIRLKHTMADPMLEAGCDTACRRLAICEILRTVQGENSKCNEIIPAV